MKVDIQGLGVFQPQRFEQNGELYCFEQEIQFRGQTVDLIIYPDDDGAAPGPEARDELKRIFEQFDAKLDFALSDLPAKLRSLCAEYQIDVAHVTDEQLVANIDWHNIKLQLDGTVECYSSNGLVTESLDIVIGFTKDMKIEYVHFDG